MISRRQLIKTSLFAAGVGMARPRLGAQTPPLPPAFQPGAPVEFPSVQREPNPRRGTKYLFIDDHEIESMENLRRSLHQPQKFPDNVVIRPEFRWENVGIQVRTSPVWLPDEKVFKMIYNCSAEGPDPVVKLGVTSAPEGGESFGCYATSVDGVNWDKTFLHRYDYSALTWRGTPVGKENNIIPGAKDMLQGPIYDPHDPNPRRRYKGLGYQGGKLRSMVSADFLEWEPFAGPTLPSGDESHLTYDTGARLFIASVKRNGPYGRSWYLITSPDFEHWTEHGLIFHADEVDQQNGKLRLQRFFDDPAYSKPEIDRPEEWRTDVYNYPIFPYEGLYLATPVMHHWAGKHTPMFENVDSRKSVELTSSRDLLNWQRVAERAPFLELSPIGDGSAYDLAQTVITNTPVVRNNELWFYYDGFRYRYMSIADTLARKYLNSSALCMARLRMDGFVSLHGGREWGTVTSKPLKVTRERLHINCDSWRGRVVTEIIDAGSGEAIPGYSRAECEPAIIDNIHEPVRWKSKNDLAALRDRTVRVRFHLWDADLYAFWFGS